MDTVFILWHVHEFGDGRRDEKLIGVYSSEEGARAALDRLNDQPGFKEHPEGFEIHPYQLDRDGWTEGFTTISAEDE